SRRILPHSARQKYVYPARRPIMGRRRAYRPKMHRVSEGARRPPRLWHQQEFPCPKPTQIRPKIASRQTATATSFPPVALVHKTACLPFAPRIDTPSNCAIDATYGAAMSDIRNMSYP